MRFEKTFLIGALIFSTACSKSTPTPLDTTSGEQRPSMSQSGVSPSQNTAVVTQEQVMAAMKVASAPGEQHALLKPYVGTWKAVAKMWPAPNVTPQISKGVSVNRSILGGRYLEQKYSSKENGETFEGQGILGYDNLSKKYVSSWIDSMGTGQFNEEGVYDPASKRLELKGEMVDPVTKKTVPVRTVTSMVERNSYTFEMYTNDPTGAEFKSLEIVYTKPGASSKKQ